MIGKRELKGLGIDDALSDVEPEDEVGFQPNSKKDLKRLWGSDDFASEQGQQERTKQALQKRWGAALRPL